MNSAGDVRPTVAVVLICDENFLLPSFATALSARKNIARPGVVVRILVIDGAPGWVDRANGISSALGISVVAASVPEIESVRQYHKDRYLPAVALARFWLERFLEPEIERFLYLDGDTLVDGSLDALLDAEIPPDGLLAASDTVRLCLNEWGKGPRSEKAYLAGIGIADAQYFNSGVLLVSRRAWREIAAQALAFLSANSSLCRSSDQSALNAVTIQKRERLSLRYNYQSEHMIVLDPRKLGIKPVIWHFTGAPKPWHSASWPWDESFNWAYREAERHLSGLGIAAPKPVEAQLNAGLTHRRRARARLRWVYPWRRATRARSILAELRA